MCIVVWVDGIFSMKLQRSADVVASGEREARTSGNDTQKRQAPEERDTNSFALQGLRSFFLTYQRFASLTTGYLIIAALPLNPL
jgi:hypothetical protein